MAQQKLGRKDYSIAVKTGTESNKSKFAKECVQGEMYFATDSKKLYVANADAGVVDSTLSELSTAGQFDPSYESSQLGYANGLFTSTDYTISVQPKMHFDAAILDGSDKVNNPASGSAVSTWGDRSGQATSYNGTQGTASAQPTFNVSGDDKYVSFDGGDVLDLANSITRASTQPWTIVQVGNASSSGSIYYTAPNVGSSYGSVQSGKYSNGIWYNRSATLATGLDLSSFNMLTVIRTGGDVVTAYQDGNSSIGSSTGSSGDYVHDSIGPSGSTKTTGRIYEAIFFDSILSTTDLNTINSYLSNKYSSLPTLTSW
jgi:hypothetical protein